MAKQKRVWAVAKGEYSDHHIMFCTTSKKKAVAFAAHYNAIEGEENYYKAEVEDYPLVTETPKRLQQLTLRVDIWDRYEDGESPDEPWWDNIDTVWDFEDHDVFRVRNTPSVEWSWQRIKGYVDRAGKPIGGGRLHVKGTDFERVRKVFGDLRAQILADEPLRYQEKTSG